MHLNTKKKSRKGASQAESGWGDHHLIQLPHLGTPAANTSVCANGLSSVDPGCSSYSRLVTIVVSVGERHVHCCIDADAAVQRLAGRCYASLFMSACQVLERVVLRQKCYLHICCADEPSHHTTLALLWTRIFLSPTSV